MRALLPILLLAACSDPRMERRLADLATRVEALDRVAAAPPAPPVPSAPPLAPASRADPATRALYEQARAAMERGDHDEAKRLLEEMVQRAPTR